MRRRVAVWLAWSLAGLSVAMFAGSIVLFILVRVAQSPSEEVTATSLSGLLAFVPFLAFPIVGAWWLPSAPATLRLDLPNLRTVLDVLRPGRCLQRLRACDDGHGNVFGEARRAIPGHLGTALGLLGIYMILLFPDGRPPSRRWRPFALFAGEVMVLILVVFVLAPGPLEEHPGMRNPFGLEKYPWLQIVAVFDLLLLPICILASALSLVWRYRRSGREVREQIKWLAFAAPFVGVVYFGSLITQLLFAPDTLSTNETPPLWISLEQNVTFLSYAGIPVAVGFAILRYRLYDIDIIINRALVYGSLTVMLALVYFGSVTVTQEIFQRLTGQGKLPQLAVVASTLVIAALFNPLRRHMQFFIDRRFYRGKYDAARRSRLSPLSYATRRTWTA